ncbi:MAG: hypothetical protein ACI37R_05615 [Candidatus Avigastranaerophilus sp.]
MKKLILLILIITSITFLAACTQTTKNDTEALYKQENQTFERKREVIEDLTGPDDTRTIKMTQPDGTVDMIKEKYKDEVLIETEIERTYSDGETERLVEKYTRDSNGNIVKKIRDYESGRKENIILKKLSEKEEVADITIERPDGSKEKIKEEIIRNDNGTTTRKRIFEDGHIETETNQ